MSASTISLATVRFFTQTGTLAPLAFGKLWAYAAGTNTPQALYSDAGGLTPLANPVILDANGEAQVWMGANAYKFNLLDSANVQQANWPQDNISSPAALAAAAQSAAQAFATAEDTAVKVLLRAEIVQQTNTAFPTTGTGSAYALTPITPILAYVIGQRYNVQFHADSLSGATIAVSALAATALKQYDYAGNKVDAVVFEDQLADVEYDGTDWVVLSTIPTRDASNAIHTRQTVFSGPRDASGNPSFLPATSAGLTLTTQNLSTTYPLYVSAANGIDDKLGVLSANVSWVLPNNQTSLLYIDISNDGVVSTGSTLLEPVYQKAGTPSTTNTQHTFNVAGMKMYVGDGANVLNVNRVFIGTATTLAGAITATGMFPYDNQYIGSGVAFPTTSTSVTLPFGLGAGYGQPYDIRFKAVCTSADLTYQVGDEVNIESFGQYFSVISSANRQVTLATSNAAATLVPAGGGAPSAIDIAKWSLKFMISRGW